MINVLVFPCGSEIALEVFNSLNDQKDLCLIGASSIDDHGKFVYKNYIANAPTVYDDNFILFFKKIVEEYKIDFIYPCMDIVLDKFKKNEEEIGCKVISSPKETTDICLSKLKTYNYFSSILRTPKIFKKEDCLDFPIFSKPDIGSSSRNTVKINNIEDLNYWTNIYPNNLLLEYLPGEEYTVDCFTSKNGELKFIGPRKRSRISNGISVNTKIIYDESLIEFANIINSNIKMNGAWFFQVKKDKDDKFCLLEIASRFGGSSVIHRLLGVNFSYLNILNEIYPNIDILINNFPIEIDRSLNTKSLIKLNFENVYVDFDDTLIINNKVNYNLISVLYKLLNENKKLYLITKHQGNIYESLKKFKINKDLFSEIYHLNLNDNKFRYIKSESIFIDDSFSERSEVFNKLGIPVFSVENIVLL